MRATIIAAILALSATMASAQQNNMAEEMSNGLTMLQNSTALVLRQYGLEADVMSLTLSQLAEIQGALTGSNNDADMKIAIEAALRK